MQKLGRPMSVEVPLARLPSAVEFLSMTAGELEIVSLLERGNVLALRQYAEAKRRFRAKTSAISPLELDEFAFYRSHHHSYYASDGPRP
jgi:hypothetical protein